jgi:hypothetical protein
MWIAWYAKPSCLGLCNSFAACWGRAARAVVQPTLHIYYLTLSSVLNFVFLQPSDSTVAKHNFRERVVFDIVACHVDCLVCKAIMLGVVVQLICSLLGAGSSCCGAASLTH